MARQYRATSAASPQRVPRIPDLFAQHDLMVDRLPVRRLGDRLSVTLTEPTLEGAGREIVLQRIRAMIVVETADRRATGLGGGIVRDDADLCRRPAPRPRAYGEPCATGEQDRL